MASIRASGGEITTLSSSDAGEPSSRVSVTSIVAPSRWTRARTVLTRPFHSGFGSCALPQVAVLDPAFDAGRRRTSRGADTPSGPAARAAPRGWRSRRPAGGSAGAGSARTRRRTRPGFGYSAPSSRPSSSSRYRPRSASGTARSSSPSESATGARPATHANDRTEYRKPSSSRSPAASEDARRDEVVQRPPGQPGDQELPERRVQELVACGSGGPVRGPRTGG